MRTAIVGHTGFIGSNLTRQHTFDECYNTANIAGIRGQPFDLVVCAAGPAVKWWANRHPEEDRIRLQALASHLAAARIGKVVVLSTVDVYPVVKGVDETFDCHALPNHAYGAHRLAFEEAVKARFDHVTVARIGGVFGPGLKKNVLYDLLHDNCLDAINPRSAFQYYNVTRLWQDLERLDAAGIALMNFVTEPIRTSDIVDRFFAGKAVGAAPAAEVHYDVHTRHHGVFGGPRHYMASAESTMTELEGFLQMASRGTAE